MSEADVTRCPGHVRCVPSNDIAPDDPCFFYIGAVTDGAPGARV